MFKMELNMEVLLGLLNIAAKDDVRNYINGIFIDTSEVGFVRYVATNGHILGVYRDSVATAEKPDATTLIIGREHLKPIRLQKYLTHGLLTVEDAEIIDDKPRSRKCTLEYGGLSISFFELDGKFPDYLGVMPVYTSGETAQFNPLLLGQFVVFGQSMLGKKRDVLPVVMHNGKETSGLIIPGIPQFFGAIIPFRSPEIEIPAWLRKQAAEVNIASTSKWLSELPPIGCDDLIAEYEVKLVKLKEVLVLANAELCV